MNFVRVDSSIRTQGSVSREVGDSVEAAWTARHPDSTITRRDLGTHPLSIDVWAVAALAGYTPADVRTPAQRDAVALAATLADELLAADAIVIGAPFYNFGVPANLKTWIDFLITDPRFGPGAQQPLAGRPLTLVIARGGGYGPGTPRAGWDHATGYLLRIFGDVFGADVALVAAELTLAAVNPAMAELVPAAEASRAQAHELATQTGRRHAELVAVV